MMSRNLSEATEVVKSCFFSAGSSAGGEGSLGAERCASGGLRDSVSMANTGLMVNIVNFVTHGDHYLRNCLTPGVAIAEVSRLCALDKDP